MKKVFVIDWILIVVFILSAYSGTELHIAGHGENHETWHNWAVFHVATSFLFLVTAAFHLATHRGWYKGIVKRGTGSKSKVTVVLSALFVFVVTTGLFLLCVNGPNSKVGSWHYGAGIVMSVIAIGHIIKRFPLLRKSIGRQRR